MANRTKITMAGARAFVPADGREAVLWDSAAPGLGLRARPNGRNWHDGIATTHPGSGHWALAAMSSMMKHAEALGLRQEDSNPCRGCGGARPASRRTT